MKNTNKNKKWKEKLKSLKNLLKIWGEHTYYEEDYTCSNPDSEENSFFWAWFLDTYKEM